MRRIRRNQTINYLFIDYNLSALIQQICNPPNGIPNFTPTLPGLPLLGITISLIIFLLKYRSHEKRDSAVWYLLISSITEEFIGVVAFMYSSLILYVIYVFIYAIAVILLIYIAYFLTIERPKKNSVRYKPKNKKK
jgi:hypothetical protein